MAKPFKAPSGYDVSNSDSRMELYSQVLPNMYHAYMEHWLGHGFERAFKWATSVTHVRISLAIEIGIDTFAGSQNAVDLPRRVWQLVIFVGIINILRTRPDNLEDDFEVSAYSSNWTDGDVAFLESVGIKAASVNDLPGDRFERPHMIVSFVPYDNPKLVSGASTSDPTRCLECLGVKLSWKKAVKVTIMKRLFTYYHGRCGFVHTPSILRNGDEDTLSQIWKQPERVDSVRDRSNPGSVRSSTHCSTVKAAQQSPNGSENCAKNPERPVKQDRPTGEHLRAVLEAFCWSLGVKQVPDLASLPETPLENLIDRCQRGDIPPQDEKVSEPAEPARQDVTTDEQLCAALEVVCESRSIEPSLDYSGLSHEQIGGVETGCWRWGLLPTAVYHANQGVPSEGLDHVDIEILLLLNAEGIAEALEVLCCACFLVGCMMVWLIVLAYANIKGSSSLWSRPVIQEANSAALLEWKQHVDECVGPIPERPGQDIPVDLERPRLEKLAMLALLEETVESNGVERPLIKEFLAGSPPYTDSFDTVIVPLL